MAQSFMAPGKRAPAADGPDEHSMAAAEDLLAAFTAEISAIEKVRVCSRVVMHRTLH